MSTSLDLKRHLTLALDQLLQKALMPGEEVAVSLSGSFGEGIVATNRRAIILRESTTIGAGQHDQVFPYPLTDVETVTMSASDVSGQLILEVAEAEGRTPPVEKRSIGFPVADFEVFEKTAAEIERLAKAAREEGAGREEETLVGAGREALACGSCGAAIRQSFLYCPKCGQQLWTLCAGCNAPIQEEWRFCVVCGRDLSGQSADPRAMRRVLAMHARSTAEPAAKEPERPAAEEPLETASPQPESESPESINRRGVEQYERGELDAAIASFKRALALDSSVAKFHTNLGVAYADAGLTDEAKESYETALRLNPNDTSALLFLGGLMTEEEDYDKARELWERVIAIAPNSPEARESRSNLLGLDNL